MGPILLYRVEIEKYLDISYLTPYLCSSDLIKLNSKVADDGIRRGKRIKWLIKVVDKGGGLAYRRFIKALKDSGDRHMGHPYLVSVLEGRRAYGTEETVVASKSVEITVRDSMNQAIESLNDREVKERANGHMGHPHLVAQLEGRAYGTMDTVEASKSVEKNIIANMPQIVESLLNGRELLHYLRQQNLLTPDEYEGLISDKMTSNARNRRILRIIGTKGPTAHYHFVECIKLSSSTVPQHETVFKLISSNLPTKLQNEEGSPKSIIRQPRNIESEGILVSKKYFTIVKELRLLYLRGRFDEAERIVDLSKLHDSTELDVALLLESCTAFITKKKEDEVIARANSTIVRNWTLLSY